MMKIATGFLYFIAVIISASLSYQDVKILFIGDEVSECYRDDSRRKKPEHSMGSCYPMIITSIINFYSNINHQNNYIIENFASKDITLSEPPSYELLESIKSFNPDVISVSLGKEYLMKLFENPSNTITHLETSYNQWIELLKNTTKSSNIIVLEPYSLYDPQNSKITRTQHHDIMQACHSSMIKIAKRHHLKLLFLQALFKEHSTKVPPNNRWIHQYHYPTPAGHYLIAKEWLKYMTPYIYYNMNKLLRNEQGNFKSTVSFFSQMKKYLYDYYRKNHTNYHINTKHDSINSNTYHHSSPSDDHTQLSTSTTTTTTATADGNNNDKAMINIIFEGDYITEGYRRVRGEEANLLTHNLGDSYVYLITSFYQYYYPQFIVNVTNMAMKRSLLKDIDLRVTQLITDYNIHEEKYTIDVFSIYISSNDITQIMTGYTSPSTTTATSTTTPTPTIPSSLSTNDVSLPIADSAFPYFNTIPNTENIPIDPLKIFENTYTQLIIKLKRFQPNMKIIICVPFVLPGTITTGYYSDTNQYMVNMTYWNQWNSTMTQIQSILINIANSTNVTYIDYYTIFSEMAISHPSRTSPTTTTVTTTTNTNLRRTGDSATVPLMLSSLSSDIEQNTVFSKMYPSWLSEDGLHPTYAGNMLISKIWMQTVDKLLLNT